jgi:hypothetical protein
VVASTFPLGHGGQATYKEVHIPNQDPMTNLWHTSCLKRLGLNFDLVGTSSVITQVFLLSVEIRRKEL